MKQSAHATNYALSILTALSVDGGNPVLSVAAANAADQPPPTVDNSQAQAPADSQAPQPLPQAPARRSTPLW